MPMNRYVNIEVAYLPQKIEEYEGLVILATNLILNINEAFNHLKRERNAQVVNRGVRLAFGK